jgi:hypothetical protein
VGFNLVVGYERSATQGAATIAGIAGERTQ